MTHADLMLDALMAVWTFVSIAVGLLSAGLQKFIAYLGSESRENKLYKKFYKKNKSALSEIDLAIISI